MPMQMPTQQYPPGVQNLSADWQAMQGRDPQQAAALQQMLAQYVAMQQQQQMAAQQAAMSARPTMAEMSAGMAPVPRSAYGAAISSAPRGASGGKGQSGKSRKGAQGGNGLMNAIMTPKDNFLRGAQQAGTVGGLYDWVFGPYQQPAPGTGMTP